jgi:hypothetical protein
MAIDDMISTQYTHSLKLEETAKGVRISVHVYGNDDNDTIKDVVQTYVTTRKKLEDERIPLAPMEIK